MFICDIWAIYLLSSGAVAFDCSNLCLLGEIFCSSFHVERMISGGTLSVAAQCGCGLSAFAHHVYSQYT